MLAADTAKFSLAYAKVGLSPDCGGSLLVHTLGLHRVLRLALLGDLITAQEAADAGLVARVVPAADLAAATDEVVATLLAGSPQAFAATKRLLRDVAERRSRDGAPPGGRVDQRARRFAERPGGHRRLPGEAPAGVLLAAGAGAGAVVASGSSPSATSTNRSTAISAQAACSVVRDSKSKVLIDATLGPSRTAVCSR